QWEFVACAGDDKTDEDMFRALRVMKRSVADKQPDDSNDHSSPHYFTITVGPSDKKSAALWHVTSSHKVVEALEMLANA
ncbi:hypothetical protein LPJ73_007875, partial [Coemansia sp. RSA 2703]